MRERRGTRVVRKHAKLDAQIPERIRRHEGFPQQAFAQSLATHLVEAGTEVAISARLQIDHGQSHAIQYLLDGIDVPVVPLVVNVFAQPLPTLARCVQLGEQLATAPGDQRVVVIASGGLWAVLWILSEIIFAN